MTDVRHTQNKIIAQMCTQDKSTIQTDVTYKARWVQKIKSFIETYFA